MHKSPHYLFDPSSVGWLERAVHKGESIVATDLVRVIEADDMLIPNDTLRALIIQALKGELKQKPGPKRETLDPMLIAISALVDLEIEDINERRAAPGYHKTGGELSPADEAHKVIAEWLKLKHGGRRLQNKLSAHNLR